jgi:2-oxoglutarate dehydrogenase E2 component (dihydrolipoamide succinyltransferase)
MSAPVKTLEVRAPAAQEEGTRSQVLRWLKALGEPVAEHEPLIELETDKVTVEVASPAAGVLTEILKQEQEEVSPGELLGRIGLPAALAAPNTVAPAHESAGHAPLGNAPSAVTNVAAPAPRLAAGAAARGLSPAVRRLMSEHALDPSAVRGTGEGGRITVADVMREIARPRPDGQAEPPERRAPMPLADKEPLAAGVAEEPTSHRVPHSAIRKRIAARMVESLLHTAPHVTTLFEVDMGAVLAHRERHREEFARGGVALTLTAYFAQAALTAIRAVPEANSRWTDTALEIYDTVNLGVATATEEGLVVPVLAHLETLSLLETARRLEELVRRARAGTLTPLDVRGGTFTLSNHGVSGSLLAAPIIIPQPQSAILGLGKLERRAVVIEEGPEEDPEERIVARSCCYATITIDHRVMDGSRANRFLQVFTERLAGWTD